MNDYTILRTSPSVYIGEGNQVVNGYQVDVKLDEFDEFHTLRVPTLDGRTVKAAIKKLLDQRRALSTLGRDDEAEGEE